MLRRLARRGPFYDAVVLTAAPERVPSTLLTSFLWAAGSLPRSACAFRTLW